MLVAFAILALLIIVILAMLITGVTISGPRYKGPVSDHFDGRRFRNPTGIKAKGALEVLQWMLRRKRGPWPEELTENFGKHPLGHFKDGIRVTYINHSTFLIQVDGVNILTDPVWSKRVSPFRWIGPRRKKQPGIRFGDLPRIHVVLLTHNHYDHLDLETMRLVFGAHHPKIITPLGVKAFLDGQYISGAIDLDWWQETKEGPLTITAVPSQHFSGRGMLDRDATLWCGYVITTSRGNVYFCGDTGYNPVTFKDIGSRCAPIKLAMLPIGAYKPRWFMSPIHVSPEESVEIHREVGATTSIAMHYGTFPLADDGAQDPVDDLQAALVSHNLNVDDFIAMKEGEVLVFE